MVDPIIQTAEFKRNAIEDIVTGQVTYGKWNPESAVLPIPSFPVINGYQIDPHDQTKIQALVVNADSPNTVETVHYYRNREINESTSPNYWYDYNNEKKVINKSYELGLNEGSNQKTNNNFITIHSTATPNATAKEEAQYFKNNWLSSEAYVQLVVDDQDCYLIGDIGYVAWGAGPTANFNSPVQIELCEFPNNPVRAQEAYTNYIHLIRQFCDILGIPKKLDRGLAKEVRTHNYWARTNHETSHTDPQTYLASIGISFEQLRSDVEGTKSTSSENTDTGQISDPSKDTGETWWNINQDTHLPIGFERENGTFHAYYEIKNRRSAPILTNKSTGMIYPGQRQKYDSAGKIGKYTWIHYRVGRPANGKYEKPSTYHGTTYREYYLPVREWNSNGTSNAWGWFS